MCVGFGFARTSLFSGFGVWPCGLLRAPRPSPASFWWGCLWRWGVRGLPWVAIVPPPSPFVFFFRLRGGCGFGPCRVVALWCPPLSVPVLDLLISVPPSPFVWAAPMFFFLPATSPVGCVPACPGCPYLWWAAALGWVSPGLAGRSSGILSGGPVGFAFGVACLGGLPASCGVGVRLPGCQSVCCPPFFFSSVVCVRFCFSWGGGSACSSLCLSWAGARTGQTLVWLTGLLWVLALDWAMPQPHGSGELCTRLAWWPLLSG